MVAFSEDYIRRLSLGDREELIVRDSKITGFALRVRRKADKTLSKVFFIVQELPARDGTRKRRKMTIGEWPLFSVEQARLEAQAMVQAIRLGDDPAAAKAAKKAAPIFQDLVEDFKESHLPAKKPATQKHYLGLISRNILPEFKDKRVCDVTAEMVRQFAWKKRKNPVDANRSLAVLSKMFGRAVELGWKDSNPCIGIKKTKEQARDAWLDEHDLPKFVSALATVTGPYGDMLRFLTVTGWRVSEAIGLRWDSVDLKRMEARLADTKTGPSVRKLSADAATLIDMQPHRSGFVFSNRKGTYPVSYQTVREILAKVCENAGIERITPHTLRHTAATHAAISGSEAHELREAFGWKTLAMTGRYVSKSESLARKGVERTAGAINIFQKPTAEIVEFKK